MWKVAPNIIHPALVKATYVKLYPTEKNPAYKSVNSSSIQGVKKDEQK
jgi:hypothetical protein